MQMRNLVMDTSDLSFEELDTLIHQLKKARERKGEARARYQNFCIMCSVVVTRAKFLTPMIGWYMTI